MAIEQSWLTLEHQKRPDGSLELVVDIHGHFATIAASKARGDVAAAIGQLFDAMSHQVAESALDELTKPGLATRQG